MPLPWPTKALGVAGEWLSGGTPSKQKPELWTGVIPWVSPKDMKVLRLGDSIDHVSEAAIGNGTRLLPVGTILIVVRGMILVHTFPVALTTRPVAFNQDIKALRVAPEFDTEFVLYWLQSESSRILQLTDVSNHGTRRLPTERLFSMQVAVPPLPEQRKIAAILTAVDETIEKTEAVIEQLGVVKKAMMQELLTRGLPGRQTRYVPLSSEWRLGRVAAGVEEIPSNWQLCKLTSVAKLESGHTPSRRNPEYWEGNIPWVSLHDSKRLDVPEILETAQTIGPLGLANSSARLLPKGTVVFSRTATVGKCTVLGREMATSQDFANYVCGPKLNPAYLMNVFRHMQREWDRLMAGSTHKTIYMPVFRELQILVPPLEEQQTIAEAAALLDKRIVAERSAVLKARDLKKALMSVLLTGELRVSTEAG